MSDPNDKRQLLAVMFTDIGGFSAMTAEDEGRTVRVVREHREIVRACLAEHHGREMRTVGDAFLVVFESAVAAVRCAVDVQERLGARNATVPAADRVWVRIGIHAGEVVLGHDGELYGETVNVAARVEAQAPAGGIAVTDVVHAQVRSHVERRFVRLGVRPLKGVEDPPELFQLVVGKPEARPAKRAPRRWPWALAAAALLAGALGVGSALRPRPVDGIHVSDVPAAQATYARAMQALAEGDNAASVALLRRAVELDPSSSRILLSRAYAEANGTEGLEYFQRAVAAAPPGPDGDLVRLVDRSLSGGDDPALAAAWDAWGEAHPEDVEGQLLRALQYPLHGREGLAVHEGEPHDHGPTMQLRSFVAAHPNHIAGLLMLAAREEMDQHFEAAQQDLQDALERCDGCAAAHMALGTSALGARQTAEADRELRRAAELDPSLAGLREALASVALFKHDEADRTRRVEALLADPERPEAERAQVAAAHASDLFSIGRFRDGRALTERSLVLSDPANRVGVLQMWIQQELEMGHVDAARALIARLREVAADPAVADLPRSAAAIYALDREVYVAFLERDLPAERGYAERIRALPADRFPGMNREFELQVLDRQLAALEGRADDALRLSRVSAPGCVRDVQEAELQEVAGAQDRALDAWRRALDWPRCTAYPRPKAATALAEDALARGDRATAAAMSAIVAETWAHADPDLPWVRRWAAVRRALGVEAPAGQR